RKGMVTVGIVGGTGYTGVELLRILARHPQARISAITSRKEAGKPVAEMFPSLRGSVDLRFSDPATTDLGSCDLVFFATPTGVAMEQTPALLERGARIIDLAADFRLKNVASWQKWYGMTHRCAQLPGAEGYGLAEQHRARIRKARVVGNPGCYATAVQLGFLPL